MTNQTTMTFDTAEDENVYCEDCSKPLSDFELDLSGYRCEKCHAKHTFTCVDCGESFDNEEASPKCKHRCATCQETKDEAELEEKKEALKDEARELLETLCIDGGLADLQKAVKALKRLQIS